MQHRSCHRAAVQQVGGVDGERNEKTGAARSMAAGDERDGSAIGCAPRPVIGGALCLGGEKRPAREAPMAFVAVARLAVGVVA
jgi:hypothetical protein